MLRCVANLAPELAGYFPVPSEGSVNGISRIAGYMNLVYQQVLLLWDTVTPLLLGIVSLT